MKYLFYGLEINNMQQNAQKNNLKLIMDDQQNVAEEYQPAEFWKYFRKISEIPRCSGKEDRIRRFIKEEAEKLAFITEIDTAGNLLVKLPSNNEDAKRLLIQSHFDMVCEKNKDSTHNFNKDPLILTEIEVKGQKWVTARGTSLGADNGVGLAYSLSMMKMIAKKSLHFPNLDIRFLFTVNEEEGLIGAFQVSPDTLEVDYLINLDCMDDSTIIIGSVGGMYCSIQIRLNRKEINELNKNMILIKLLVKGLLGGHSGLDIDKGRANAIKIMARIFKKISQSHKIHLESIMGGNNFNAIPREATALFYINKEELEQLNEVLCLLQTDLNEEYAGFEENIQLELIKMPKKLSNAHVFPNNIQKQLIDALYVLPHGPLSKHPVLKDLVHTSTNLASINTSNTRIKIQMLHRSFEMIQNEKTAEKVSTIFKMSDLSVKIKNAGGYGVWNPQFEDELLLKAKRVYKRLFRKEPHILAMHAGLECGAFKTKAPDLEMITIGPTIEACHSPDEKLNVSSVGKFWNFLIPLLKEL
ncbi:MAG: Cytosol non-specific dipeptidase [Promethearchaeota archaeon]|nr:MAG: Cytosol non-specific dipeptidase [Candidatus Lokiarchaeota archaeon]